MTEKTAQKEPGKKPVPSKKPKPQQEVVVQIPLSELHPFPDHPFQVREDASMQETAESVKEYGVLVPALARPREDGGYELIAGHRRKHACELAGLATMPVIVRDIDRDAATIIMVDSNLQRENILPSERAKAYKMKMEAIKRQGARTDLTSPKISAKFRSDDEVGQDAGVSGDNERWYAVDGGSKHLRITEDGAKYAYELYDKDTLHLLESGTVHDDDVNFLLAAAIRICETHGYDKTVPFEVLSNEFAGILYSLELSSDDNQVVHEEAGSHAAGTLPTSPELEQATPMPDPTLTVDDMRSYGYLDGDMLPLSKDRALELLEHDITVYMLHPDNAEEMVFEAEDIIKHDGMFGITQPDWDAVKGHIPPRDVEQRFLNSPTDSMAIYQLRRDAPVELRFASLGSLAAPPDPANYEAIYTREVYPDDDTGRILENFYYIFNDERPGDFVGHSLSVSDIVALKQNGKVSYHYCDSMGFQELPAFQKPENYLKAAEMSMEDDYGMIDGIINNGSKQPTVANLEAQVKAGMSISLMDLAAAAHRERDAGERKPSVLEQLKSQPAQERPHKTAPKKSAEKEL